MSRWHEELVDVAPGTRLETVFKGTTSSGSTTRLAFIAHPLGRLGGTYNDYVVREVAKRLLVDHNYTVVLMNSRGVGKSQGWASFSGIAEAEDYQAVTRHYLERFNDAKEVLFCGYSAGSLSASYCDPLEQVKTRYLLISYPLSALWALTLFRTSPFSDKLSNIVRNGETPLLSIRGDQDQFTADKKYSVWETEQSRIGDNSTFFKVEGADHFWSNKEHLQTMLDKISTWLSAGTTA
ncbi:alpha/beta-hydrolase [Cystobasidium minutum MCA 4210]|uniref:alpha/beta-hydrolase n=1 Tax=Cystobasidium minutum MCA 4210 TaxID=1397322 RepID=UPI0034CE7DFA|eukprot:jgi/Rhomi1/52459/CE52458_1106